MASERHRSRSIRHDRVSDPPSSTSSSEDNDDEEVSSDETITGSDVELEYDTRRRHEKRRQRRRRGRRRGADGTSLSSSGSGIRRRRRSTTTTAVVPTWTILILGSLVVIVTGAAGYFYLEQHERRRLGDGSDETVTSTLAAAAGLDDDAASGPTVSSSSATTVRATRNSVDSGRSTVDVEEASSLTRGDGGKSSSPTTTGAPRGNSTQVENEGNPGSRPTPRPSSGASTESLRCKKGVGYNNVDYTLQLDICWAYDWDSKGSGLKDGVMYIPMLWGTKKLDGWEAAVDAAISNGATHVLGFNEPDLAEQANLSPSAAAALWTTAMEPLATKNVKLVSPAVSNGVKTKDGKPMGIPWMLEFLEACKGCTIDAIALHWYDSANNIEYFQKHLEQAHANLSKPIWLTEFMGTGPAADQAAFVRSSVEWLEDQDYIEAYAAFGDFCDNAIANFVDCKGVPNELGKAYSEAK